MLYITISLGVLLAIVSLTLASKAKANKRLKDITRRDQKDLFNYSRMIGHLQYIHPDYQRSFHVSTICGSSVVYMCVSTPSGEINVAIKGFFDPDDADFARREAEEFKGQCEEAI